MKLGATEWCVGVLDDNLCLGFAVLEAWNSEALCLRLRVDLSEDYPKYNFKADKADRTEKSDKAAIAAMDVCTGYTLSLEAIY